MATADTHIRAYAHVHIRALLRTCSHVRAHTKIQAQLHAAVLKIENCESFSMSHAQLPLLGAPKPEIPCTRSRKRIMLSSNLTTDRNALIPLQRKNERSAPDTCYPLLLHPGLQADNRR